MTAASLPEAVPSPGMTIATPSSLDRGSAESFRRDVFEALERLLDGDVLCVDARSTRHLDSVGAFTLILIRREALRRRCRVELTGAHPDVRALLTLVKLDDLLEPEDAPGA
jgi:anti-anti-sigma regulatory factor